MLEVRESADSRPRPKSTEYPSVLRWAFLSCQQETEFTRFLSGFGRETVPGANSDVLRMIMTFRSDPPKDDGTQADACGDTASESRPSFEAVIRSFHKRVYNLAYRLLGDLDEAADVTQETFVKAYKAYSRFSGESEAVYPWLCRIAVNGCKNKFREMERRSRHEAWSLNEPIEIGGASTNPEIGDRSADPATIVQQRDLESRTQQAIQSLAPEFRVVVVLRDMQGLSYKEIAEATGATLEVVKVRLFRGREILRRRLSPYVTD